MVLQGMPTHSATNIFTHTNNYTHIYMDTNRRAETDTGTHAHTYARTYADACERRETYNSQPQTHLSLTRHLQTQASMHTLTHTRTHARTHADTHARTRARIHARMHTRRRLRAERDVPVYFDSGWFASSCLQLECLFSSNHTRRRTHAHGNTVKAVFIVILNRTGNKNFSYLQSFFLNNTCVHFHEWLHLTLSHIIFVVAEAYPFCTKHT